MRRSRFVVSFLLALASIPAGLQAAAASFTMAQVLDYPYSTGLAAAERGGLADRQQRYRQASLLATLNKMIAIQQYAAAFLGFPCRF